MSMVPYQHQIMTNRVLAKGMVVGREERQSMLKLKKKNWLKSSAAISIDWILIFAAIYLSVEINFWFLPLTIVVVGSRQRALSNLTHDASHGNLFKNRRINDLVANLFAALPMHETVTVYRRTHFAHHKWLGDKDRDPDSKTHLRYEFDDRSPPTDSALKWLVRIVINQKAFIDSCLGSWTALSHKQLLGVIIWWLTVFVMLLNSFGGYIAVASLVIWCLSRACAYHLIRVCAEFTDHAGLKVGPVVEFTRNIPQAGFLRHLVHPHNDNFHLVHHLWPNIPHYNIKKAFGLVCHAENMKSAHNCTGYLFGRHPLLSCLSRRCGDME